MKIELENVLPMDIEKRSFEIITEKPIPVSLDGEILHTTNIKCEIVKKAINFIVPENLLTN